MKRYQIGVIGSAGPEEYKYTKPDSAMYQAAEELGMLLGKQNYIVINGGKGGVMEAVSKGAQASGGITVAELAGNKRGVANSYVDVEIVSHDQGFRGPSLLVGMCDAVIALGGGAGTLQEIAVAYRMQKLLILIKGFGGWTDRLSQLEYLDERRLMPFMVVDTILDAVKAVENTLKGGNK